MSDEELDVKDQATSSEAQADTAVTANSEQATTSEPTDVREDLVKQLTQGAVEETPTETETAEAEETDDEDDEDDSSNTPKSETKPEDDESLPPDTKERTKKAFTRLREKAAFGDLITKTLVDANIKPDEFSRWTNLAARLKKGDPSAVSELVATAKAFGYKEPIVEQSKPAKTVDDIADEIYKAEFAKEVEDLNISEPLARKQARKLAEVARKSEPAQEAPQKQQPVDNRTSNPIRDHALAAIDADEAKYRSTIPEYEKIAPKVVERLQKEYGGMDPIYWVAGYRDIVNDELRKARPAPAPAKAPIKAVAGTQIRPTSVAAPAANFDGDDVRSSIANRLVKGWK